MSLIRGLRRCVRLFKQRGSAKMLQDRRHIGAMSMEQRRHFRYDDRINWPTGNPGEGKVLKDEGFDPRYDERHYKSYQGSNYGSGSRDPESRRRIQQDTVDHQRRQERIIQENKHRWQHRSEPKTNIKYTFEHTRPLNYAGPGKRNDPAEEYSRRRRGREQRQKEVQRQERELRESRKNYNLPGYNRPAKGAAEEEQAPVAQEATQTKYVSKEWLEKRAKEDEQRYWHTWSTCPDERVDKETAPDASEEIMHGYNGPRGYPRGLTKPPSNYDGGVRRFQTHSVQLTDDTPAPPPPAPVRRADVKRQVKRRKPNGMDKQYKLARDFTRINRLSDESDVTLEDYGSGFKRSSSALEAFQTSKHGAAFGETEEQQRLEDIELPEQPPRMKLAWQGLPRPVYKRFDGIKRAIAHRTKRRLQPPRFQMTVKSKGLSRLRTPIDCFSSKLDIDTRYTPISEYLGYGRQTVCDAWQDFTSKNSLKSIY